MKTKRVQPTLRAAFAGQTLALVLHRPRPPKSPVSPKPHRGKQNYLGGPGSKTKVSRVSTSPPARPPALSVSRDRTNTQGRFIGDSEQLIAFVMLDDETLQRNPAANSPVF